MDGRPIAIFDSGMGGLTVLHECLVTMPNEDFVYLGDNGRFPYGPRPLDEIRAFALEIGRFFERQGVKLVVVACNSATSAALADLQAELEVPVAGRDRARGRRRRSGDTQPPHRPARDRGDRRRRALRGARALARRRRSVLPDRLPGPGRADRERGALRHRHDRSVRSYAKPLKQIGVDTVILGCTHYPLIRHVLERAFGRGVTLVFSAEETARKVAETLARKGIARASEREGACRFLTTGDPEQFRLMGERFLQLPIAEVEAISLAELGVAQ